ncbi:MAG: transcriptional regulator, partial [Pseudomonadota bacterium]|nr:transcriptional regulator [Pseudomonadota bacterium]
MRWKIRDFVLCEQQQTLSSPQHSVRIEPMMSELLAYFCHHQGVVVSKEQLLDDVWHGRYVSDNSIAKLVTKLRKALGDDARNPMYIATIPKRGYRLVAPVEQISEPSELTEVQQSGSAASERSLPSSFLGMVLLVAIATAVG